MSDSSNGVEVQVVPLPPPQTKKVTYSSGKPQVFVDAPKANDAVQFFKAAFGAEEVNRTVSGKRKAEQDKPNLISVELKIGSFSFLVAELAEDTPAAIKAIANTGTVICLETEEVEAAINQAVTAGAIADGKILAEGEAAAAAATGMVPAKLRDPYGNLWFICSPPKDAAANEAQSRLRTLI